VAYTRWRETTIEYEVLGIIGEGASGIVQEARLPSTSRRVALKRLRPDGPHDTAHLKREFRTLSDVAHPNLVRLHQLFDDGDDVVLAMDLVDGHTFLDWVWGRPRADVDDTGGYTWSSGGSHAADRPTPEVAERPELDEPLLDRLRQGLRGLAAGLSALHAAGLLHRDIKPGNVMVDHRGRVRVVDFGLAMRPGMVESISGTVAYMAPEQISGGELTAASDWYGVGSLLFEALTGRTPFVGPSARMLFDKQLHPAPPVHDLAPDAPADLAALCDELLRREPDTRPAGTEVCDRLGATSVASAAPPPFVGRRDELAQLTTALHRSGRRVVHVCAPSGLGKTRLMEHFVAEACQRHLVLAARCYEREHTAFKALDPLAVALAQWLRERPPLALDLGDWGPMARLLAPLASAAPTRIGPPGADPVAERLAATHQLVRLLAAVAEVQPLVLWIDDLQWADRDSLLLLREVLGDPALPELLCVLGWRSDHPGVDELLQPLTDLPSDHLELSPLPTADALELLRAQGADEARAAHVVAEAGGSPFFLAELLLADGDHPDLAAVVRHRVGQLDPGSRQLLHTVAVAARPLAPEVALGAAQQASGGDVVTLLVARLLTTRRGQSLECTHDKIREVAVASLPGADLAAHHRQLAEAMGPHADPELLCEHWAAAGEAPRAAPLALEAARHAEEALAFEKAVTLYRRARALGARFDPPLQVAFGRALGRAGYAEGADELLAAAERVPARQRPALEREALHQLLRAGRIEEARPLLPRVVRRLGLPWPRTRIGTMADILWTAARVRIGAVRQRRGGDARDEEALELALELSMSLSFVDMVRTAMLTGRAIALAEGTGEPATRALAAAMRGSNAALLGDADEGRRQLARSEELLPEGVSAVDRAALRLHHGIAASSWCDFPRAEAVLSEVVEVFDGHGLPYEAGMAQTFRSFAMVQLGAFAEARALRKRMIRQARQRGDKHLEMFFRTSYALPPGLMDDDPQATWAHLHEVRGRWGEGLSTIWLYGEITAAKAEVYQGDRAAARQRLAHVATAARGGALLSVPLNAVGLWTTWAAAAAPDAHDDATARRQLKRAVAKLRSLRSPFGPTFADAWQASLGGPRAVASWRRAHEQLQRLHNPWLAEIVEAQGALLEGRSPDPHYDALAARGLVDPVKLCDLFAYAPRPSLHHLR